MILRADRTVQTAQGQAVSGALVYVLTQPADTVGLTTLATVYASTTGAAGTNPVVTDGLGQAVLYLDNAQLYTLVVESPLIGTQVYPDQNLGAGPAGGATVSTGAATLFAQVPAGTIDGTNTVFTISVAPSLLFLQQNATLLVPGVGYTLAGNVITFATAPRPGDSLYASGVLAAGDIVEPIAGPAGGSGIYLVPSSATPVFDGSQGTLQQLALTANVAVSTAQRFALGVLYTFEIVQAPSGSGPFTFTWPAGLSGGVTVSPKPGARTVLLAVALADGTMLGFNANYL